MGSLNECEHKNWQHMSDLTSLFKTLFKRVVESLAIGDKNSV